MSYVNAMNERLTQNGLFFNNPKERNNSIYKPNDLSIYHLSSSHPLSKRISKESFSKRNKSSNFIHTSKNDNNNNNNNKNSIFIKKNSNNLPSSLSLIKFPLLLSKKIKREKSYIVHSIKVPEVSIFHSKLLNHSILKSISPHSSMIELNMKMNDNRDQVLFSDDKEESNHNEKENEKKKKEKKNNSLTINSFDSIYRNNKKMTNGIRQRLSDEILKATQNYHSIKSSNDNSRKHISMYPSSLIKTKRHIGSMTDIKEHHIQHYDQDQKTDNDNVLNLKKRYKMKKVKWNFINKKILRKHNTTNQLQISKYAKPRIVIQNDSLVKQMLFHNLSSLININQ